MTLTIESRTMAPAASKETAVTERPKTATELLREQTAGCNRAYADATTRLTTRTSTAQSELKQAYTVQLGKILNHLHTSQELQSRLHVGEMAKILFVDEPSAKDRYGERRRELLMSAQPTNEVSPGVSRIIQVDLGIYNGDGPRYVDNVIAPLKDAGLIWHKNVADAKKPIYGLTPLGNRVFEHIAAESIIRQ